MNEMIERVAFAIYRRRLGIINPLFQGDALSSWQMERGDEREFFIGAARAAIEAMREPTEAMMESPSAIASDFKEIWQAMIDTAAKPLPPI